MKHPLFLLILFYCLGMTGATSVAASRVKLPSDTIRKQAETVALRILSAESAGRVEEVNELGHHLVFTNGRHLASLIKEYIHFRSLLVAENSWFAPSTQREKTTLDANAMKLLVSDYSEELTDLLEQFDETDKNSLPMFPVFDKDAAASTNNWRLFRSGMVLELGRTLGRIPISRSGFIAWLIKLRKQVLSERCELFLTPTPGGN